MWLSLPLSQFKVFCLGIPLLTDEKWDKFRREDHWILEVNFLWYFFIPTLTPQLKIKDKNKLLWQFWPHELYKLPSWLTKATSSATADLYFFTPRDTENSLCDNTTFATALNILHYLPTSAKWSREKQQKSHQHFISFFFKCKHSHSPYVRTCHQPAIWVTVSLKITATS